MYLAALALPVVVSAQGLTSTIPFAGTASGDPLTAIRFVVNALLVFVSLLAATYLVIAGVRYITSQGDEDAAAGAKNTILYAIIGLIIIGLSAVIVNFVISAVGAGEQSADSSGAQVAQLRAGNGTESTSGEQRFNALPRAENAGGEAGTGVGVGGTTGTGGAPIGRQTGTLPSSRDVTPGEAGWQSLTTSTVFEWQYHWVRSPNGSWAIVSVGQNPTGASLLIISGTRAGTHTVRTYQGALTAAAAGFDIHFSGGGATYAGSEEGGGERVVINTPEFSLNALFTPSDPVLHHGDVRINSMIVSPNYYSRPLTVSGQMMIAGLEVALSNAPAENDHQYGVVSPLPPPAPPLGPLNHDWVYGTATSGGGNELTFVATTLRNPNGPPFANYLLVRTNGSVQRTEDVVFTIEERFGDGFSKRIRVTSDALSFDMVLDVPPPSSSALVTLPIFGTMQENGNALVTGAYQNQSYTGVGVKESTNQD